VIDMTTNVELKNEFKKYAVPMIIRSIFNSVMFTADKLVAALFIGTSALVATTLISPLMFLIGSLAMFFISGLGAYVGLLIGKENVKKANEVSSSVVVLMTMLGIAMMIPSIVFSNELAYALGARGKIFKLSVDYLEIFSLCFPLLLVGKGIDVLILNDGSPKYSFILNIITTTLNVIAVAVLGFGIKGLAGSTLISSAVQLIGGIIYFARYAKIIKFVKFLTPKHFEAYAVVSIITTLFYGIYMGSSMGLQPILSQMMAKGQFEKLKGLINYSVKQTFMYGLFLYLAIMPVVDQVLFLFIKELHTLELAKIFYYTLGFATLSSNFENA